MAIKDSKDGISWNEWEDALKNREETALEKAREELAEEIDFYKFQQYEFDKQWSQLHAYANKQGIQIVGDIPIYVAFDGADTWASPELFQFDEENNPVAVAGCPPDDFSATGQLWGKRRHTYITNLILLLFVRLVYVGIRWYAKGWWEIRGCH